MEKMAEKENVIEEKVEHSGLFDFPVFYSFAHSWFGENGYGVQEEKYSEKVSGNKRDIDIEWKASKNVSDYFKFEYKIKFRIKDLTDIEAEIDGEKKKMNKGSVEVEMNGALIKDPKSKWDTSPLNRFMRDIYNKYIIPSRVDSMRAEVSNSIKDFKEQLKYFLELTGRR